MEYKWKCMIFLVQYLFVLLDTLFNLCSVTSRNEIEQSLQCLTFCNGKGNNLCLNTSRKIGRNQLRYY